MKQAHWLAIGCMLLPALSPAQGVFNGVWRPDPQKPGEHNPPQITELVNGVFSCKSCEPPYQVKADGHEQALKGNPDVDSMAVSIIDDHTVMKTAKGHGASFIIKSTVSADGAGKTEVQTITGMSPVPIEVTDHYTRVAAGAPHSHLVSGSWLLTLEEVSNNAEDTTFKIADGTLSMSDLMGRSFSAKLDGTRAPFHGSSDFNGVSLKVIDANTIEESDLKDGKVVKISRWTVGPDGKTMHARFDDTHGHIQNEDGHKIQ